MSEPEKDINQIKEERLEKIIEQKVEEKTQKLERQNQKLKKEIQNLKPSSNNIANFDNKVSNRNISRRQFLKKTGLGTAGLLALGLAPVSALNIKSDSFSVSTDSDTEGLTENLAVDTDSGVEILNANLDMNNNDIEEVNQINGQDAEELGPRSADVSMPEDRIPDREPDTWYVNDQSAARIIEVRHHSDETTRSHAVGHINNEQSDNPVAWDFAYDGSDTIRKSTLTMIIPSEAYYKVENLMSTWEIDAWIEYEFIV